MLRLVNENKTPIDVNQALDFIERKAYDIHKRYEQLRKDTNMYSSEYQDYMMLRCMQ